MNSWPNLRCSVDCNRCEPMLLWYLLKCNLDWKECDKKISRPIWSTIWIRTDDRGWRLELIWGDIWIGTHVKGCCLGKIKVLCGL
jgi:hypothetical protein